MRHIKLILLCLVCSLTFTGCGFGAASKDTKIEDIQKEYKEGTKSGIISIVLNDTNVTMDFKSDHTQFYATDFASYNLYVDENNGYYNNGNGWEEITGDYSDIFSLKDKSGLTISTEETINTHDCYTIKKEENAAFVYLLSSLAGIEPESISDTVFTYHIEKNTGNLIDVGLSSKINRNKETYVLSTSITIEENELNIEKPKDLKYEPGTIDQNIYKNDFFQISVTGDTFILFDQNRTTEIDNQYKASKSKFSQEAYAENGVRKLSIVKGPGEIGIKQYLEKSKAQDISEVLPINISGINFSYAFSHINESKTITYAITQENNQLYITLYYLDDQDLELFKSTIHKVEETNNSEGEDNSLPVNQNQTENSEKSNIIQSEISSTSEVSNLSPERPVYRILSYEAEVPDGFNYDTSSSEIDAQLSGSITTIHVLGFKNDTASKEIDKESSGKEVVTKDNVLLENGTNMTYMIVKNTEGNLTYYSYMGIIEKDNNVLKIFTVAKNNEYSFKNDFIKIGNGIK